MNNLTYFVYIPLLGIFIAALLHSLNIRSHERRKFFNEAAKEFRKSFEPTISFITYLKPYNKMRCPERLPHYLTGIYLEHWNHMKELRFHISFFKCKRFDLAWKEYKYPYCHYEEFKNKPRFRFADYLIEEERNGLESAKSLAIEKIENILKFTEPK